MQEVTSLPANARELLGRIEERRAIVAVIGLGYVGLPLALLFADSGFSVLGFDVDAEKVATLRQGRHYIGHLREADLRPLLDNESFTPTTDFRRLREADAILICVPTPLTSEREPDLSYVASTIESIARTLRNGQLIVLESTTYPGTTREVAKPALEATGLRAGSDFYLAYSPEREDPGNARYTTAKIPKIVGGLENSSTRLASRLYSQVVDQVIPVSSCEVAEATKLTENIFRAVNIALVNELKTAYDAMGIDIWEILDAAETKPFGFMRFNPGPGWGGHCVPLDPFYFSWRSRQFGVDPRFIELAGKVNVEMPLWVVGKLSEALGADAQNLAGYDILLLGLAYKKNVGDPRESPAFEILELLLERGATVSYHDPHIDQAPATRSWPDLPPLRSRPLSAAELQGQHAVVIVTDHEAIDFELVRKHAPLIVDTRGVYRERSPHIISA